MKNKKSIKKGPKIVVIGGGTGLSVLLRGLKKYTANITAIVTVADDGGGSGVLREDLGMLPPGDIRSCILALANTEPRMEELMQYRFTEGKLEGQSFGNLFLAAMNEIHGSFERAIKEVSNILAITGKVLPMTLENVVLNAKLENGSTVVGESNIPKVTKIEDSKIEKVFLFPNKCNPLQDSVEAIREADLIVLGPGSLYTSIIPNLLINNIVDEIYKSKAKKAYIVNVMTQPGETDFYSAVDHVEAILSHSKKDFIQYAIVNKEDSPENTLMRYRKDGSRQVLIDDRDKEIFKKMNIELIEDSLLEVKKDYIRHDSDALSKILIDLAKK